MWDWKQKVLGWGYNKTTYTKVKCKFEAKSKSDLSPLKNFIVSVAPLLNKAIQHLQWWSSHYPFFFSVLQALLPLRQPLHRSLAHCFQSLLPHKERGRPGQSQVKKRLIWHWGRGLAARAWREHSKLSHLIVRGGGTPLKVVINGGETWLKGPGLLETEGWTPAVPSCSSCSSFTANTNCTRSDLGFVWCWYNIVSVLDGASRLRVGVGLVLCLTTSQSLSGVIERGVEAPQSRQLLLIFSDLQQLLCDSSCSRNNIWRTAMKLNLFVCSRCQCVCLIISVVTVSAK